jgi:hypothetical protein
MKAIRPVPLIIFAVVAGAAGWALNTLAMGAGWAALRFPWTALFSMALLCVVTLGLGIAVWRSRTGKAAAPIDPILAARTLVLGQACAHVGALITGWHAGILLGMVPAWTQAGGSDTVSASLASALGGLVMVACGIAVEYFCRIPPEEGDGVEPQPQP